MVSILNKDEHLIFKLLLWRKYKDLNFNNEVKIGKVEIYNKYVKPVISIKIKGSGRRVNSRTMGLLNLQIECPFLIHEIEKCGNRGRKLLLTCDCLKTDDLLLHYVKKLCYNIVSTLQAESFIITNGITYINGLLEEEELKITVYTPFVDLDRDPNTMKWCETKIKQTKDGEQTVISKIWI